MKDLQFGEQYEHYIAQWLQEHNVEAKIVDSSLCDIVLTKSNIKLEVKADRWISQTGNLCLELYSHIDLGNEGWLQYSVADILVYLAVNKYKVDKMLFYDFPSFKGYVFWEILGGDWLCSRPKIGRIVPSSSSPKVRNLLVPAEEMEAFLLPVERVLQN